jgi:hypothetical protein
MYLRSSTLALLMSIAGSSAVLAQEGHRQYAAPRTEYGHPDFQGNWSTAFLTMLERPKGVDNLIASPEQAEALTTAIRKMMPAVIDPDVQIHDIKQLAMVKGEYRTSMIVEPADGKIPFTEAGLALAGRVKAREQKFDNPEERPLPERCLENLGEAPIRTVPVFLPRQIVQTRDYVVISPEGPAGLRTIHLRDEAPPAAVRSIGGYSTGHWEGDTLVVRTTHLRADDPSRAGMGRALVISRGSTITERFTRVSDRELFYQFTVEDPELYTQPWTGEFSLARFDDLLYEYACHEGNYSLPNILRGGQAEAARLTESKRSDDVRVDP